MKAAWRCEKDHVVCRWSGVGKPAPYNPPWMHAAGIVDPRASAPAFLDFTRLSPFGGYDPNRGYGSPDCVFQRAAPH